VSLTARTATTALFATTRAAMPCDAVAQGSTTPEVRKALPGSIALIDAAPLITAKKRGRSARYGMPEVEVSKQESWGATRGNLLLDGEGGPAARGPPHGLPLPRPSTPPSCPPRLAPVALHRASHRQRRPARPSGGRPLAHQLRLPRRRRIRDLRKHRP
jgi:hypothetical protein